MTISVFLLIAAQTLWYFLPALIANMAPVFATRYNWLASLAQPLDRGYRLGDDRLLGESKTIRGLVVAILFGSLTAFFQYTVQEEGIFQAIALYHLPTAVSAAVWGAVLGLAALLGDLIKSFFKRRLHIQPGRPWIPWDQIDVVLGVFIFASWMYPLPLSHLFFSLIIILLLMFCVSTLGVQLKIKEKI